MVRSRPQAGKRIIRIGDGPDQVHAAVRKERIKRGGVGP